MRGSGLGGRLAPHLVAITRRLRSSIWSTGADTVQSGVARLHLLRVFCDERGSGGNPLASSSTAPRCRRGPPPGGGRRARAQRDGVRGRRRARRRSASSRPRPSSTSRGTRPSAPPGCWRRRARPGRRRSAHRRASCAVRYSGDGVRSSPAAPSGGPQYESSGSCRPRPRWTRLAAPGGASRTWRRLGLGRRGRRHGARAGVPGGDRHRRGRGHRARRGAARARSSAASSRSARAAGRASAPGRPTDGAWRSAAVPCSTRCASTSFRDRDHACRDGRSRRVSRGDRSPAAPGADPRSQPHDGPVHARVPGRRGRGGRLLQRGRRRPARAALRGGRPHAPGGMEHGLRADRLGGQAARRSSSCRSPSRCGAGVPPTTVSGSSSLDGRGARDRGERDPDRDLRRHPRGDGDLLADRSRRDED